MDVIVKGQEKIPKIIHYCWFGKGEMPSLAIKCINSWKTHLSDYKLIRWSEDNFDINYNPFVKEAYDNNKFAFVCDYVRLYALYNYGGIYLDTDVEVIKAMDPFLMHEAFIGFETQDRLSTGVIGSVKENEIIGQFMDYYKDRHFVKKNGTFDMLTNVAIITEYCVNLGIKTNNELQSHQGLTIYPKTYFSPLSWNTEKTDFSDETYTIHYFAASWQDSVGETKKKNSIITKLISSFLKTTKAIIGHENYRKLKDRLK